jgi:hypothetical protein
MSRYASSLPPSRHISYCYLGCWRYILLLRADGHLLTILSQVLSPCAHTIPDLCTCTANLHTCTIPNPNLRMRMIPDLRTRMIPNLRTRTITDLHTCTITNLRTRTIPRLRAYPTRLIYIPLHTNHCRCCDAINYDAHIVEYNEIL